MLKYTFLSILVLSVVVSCKVSEPEVSEEVITTTDGVPAFPGATGYAKFAKGGRGGAVYYVTNLNNSGAGSLRQAAEASGARTIMFLVGGTIQLSSNILINDPNLTIAGQTAPGDGICLKGSGLYINASDVIVQYIRIRPGDGSTGHKYSDRDGIDIGGNADNVIIDHVSVSWAIDENISLWDEPTNITIQNSIISEGLKWSFHEENKPHSMGLLIGDNSKNISVHRNLFVSNNDRNPRFKDGVKANFTNNIVYNWGDYAAGATIENSSNNVQAIVTGNYFNNGLDSKEGFFDAGGLEGTGSKIYLRGNSGDDDVLEEYNDNPSVSESKYDYLTSSLPHSMPNTDLKTSLDIKLTLGDYVGASFPKRDDVDKRIVFESKYGGGDIIDSPSEAGGYPYYSGTSYIQDTDLDGLTDSYEIANNLDPYDGDDATYIYGSTGYTNLEIYLHSLTD